MKVALVPTWLQEFDKEAGYNMGKIKKLFHETTNNRFVKWINKVWGHERDRIGDIGFRSFMHIPIGMLVGIPIIGKPLLDIFIKYEDNEDFHTRDQAWKDYRGVIVGEIITEIIVIGLLVWLVAWLRSIL